MNFTFLYTACDTCKTYKKLARLTQERYHCIRNCIYLFTNVHYMFTKNGFHVLIHCLILVRFIGSWHH